MKNRAFTLIELLVYVGVLILVLGTIFFFIVNIVSNERSIGDRVRMMDEADFVMRQVIDQTRGAKSIDRSTQFAAGGNGGQLALIKTSSTVNFYVDVSDPLQPKLMMVDSVDPSYIRTLTSPRVAVDIFALTCVGSPSSACAALPTSDPQGVRITLGLRDVTTNQSTVITTSATPRGY
ncbi:MAG: hypothetical protein AAB367_01535 [Patescibacteria group bacterium]